MKKYWIPILLMLFATSIFAQEKDAKEGFIIDDKGEKHTGSFVLKPPVKSSSATAAGQKSKLIFYKNGEKVDKIKAKDLEMLVMAEDTFHVVIIEDVGKPDYEFANLIVDGPIQLYSVPFEYVTGGSAARGTGTMTFQYAYREKGDKVCAYAYPIKWSRKRFAKLVKDHPTLANEVIENTKVEFLKQLRDVVTEYNEWKLNQ